MGNDKGNALGNPEFDSYFYKSLTMSSTRKKSGTTNKYYPKNNTDKHDRKRQDGYDDHVKIVLASLE